MTLKTAPKEKTRHEWRLVYEATQPVSHAQGKEGNTQVLRTAKFIDHSGEIIRIPIISGNSFRHQLRSASADMLCFASPTPFTAAEIGLLYTGGVLGSKRVNSTLLAEIRAAVPHLALFGHCVGNVAVESATYVSDMLPVVKELAAFTGIDTDLERWAIQDIVTLTRHDPASNKATLLSADSEENESLQMIFNQQVIAAGTKLVATIDTDPLTEIEAAWLRTAIAATTRVGGMTHRGFGTLKLADPITEKGDRKIIETWMKNHLDTAIEVIQKTAALCG